MLYRTHVISALEKTREEFARFERSLRGEVGELAARLVALAGRTSEEVRRESGAVPKRLAYPSDELDSAGAAVLPVAAVQIASFENPHTPEGRYTKDVHFEVIPPEQLLARAGDYESPEQVVALRRFELEARAVRDFLESRRGWQGRGERAPLAFFDNTLLVASLRKGTDRHLSQRMAEALAELIAVSREASVPVVGYVDHSYAHDVAGLLA